MAAVVSLFIYTLFSVYPTSQRCSRCGFTQKSNRNGATFNCQNCGWGGGIYL
ncbi:MAG: zinc ribbon domain-containing protein [Halobacteria archaeon]